MKKIFLVILCGIFLPFVLSCDNDNKEVVGQIPRTITPPQTQPVSRPGYVYGNYFRVQNTSVYQTLMEACRRCGTRRFTTGPGGTTYQRHYVPRWNPKRCRNWNSAGYMQIEFSEKKLPTTATVLILPKYTGVDSSVPQWGEPFSITTTARPINENKGFQISVRPADGLGGLHSIDITSDISNHVERAELNITVTYGSQDSQIITETLQSLKEKAVKNAAFDCQTYTN